MKFAFDVLIGGAACAQCGEIIEEDEPFAAHELGDCCVEPWCIDCAAERIRCEWAAGHDTEPPITERAS